MPSRKYLILRSARSARLEARATPMQSSSPASHRFIHNLTAGEGADPRIAVRGEAGEGVHAGSGPFDGGKLGHGRQRPPEVMRAERFGAANADPRQRAAMDCVPIEELCLAFGGDDIGDEAPTGWQL